MIANLVFVGLIGLQAIMKPAISHANGTPPGLQAITFIWTFIIASGLVMGEIKMPAPVFEYFPLLLSRCARGYIMIFLAFLNTAGEFFTIFLCVTICLAGILNIWFGRLNPPLSTILAPNPLLEEQDLNRDVELKEIPSGQRKVEQN